MPDLPSAAISISVMIDLGSLPPLCTVLLCNEGGDEYILQLLPPLVNCEDLLVATWLTQ